MTEFKPHLEETSAPSPPPRLERSPHPYHRRGSQLEDYGGLPTPKTSQYPPDTDLEQHSDTREQQSEPTSRSHSDVDEEVEDAGLRFVKALPAAPRAPRKGLRMQDGEVVWPTDNSPLLTPSLLNEQSKSLIKSYFAVKKSAQNKSWRTEEYTKAREKFTRRRRAELVRRFAEALSLIFICAAVFSNERSSKLAILVRGELLWFAGTLFAFLVLYPLRLLWPRKTASGIRTGSFAIPAAFDPAPCFYPTLLPVLISISLASTWSGAVTASIVLGISSLPPQLFPGSPNSLSLNSVQWIAALLPVSFGSRADQLVGGLEPEMLSMLYPLHQCLLPAVHYLTTTSLLVTELQLLCTGLACLLLLSSTPQTVILTTVLWVGGLGLYITCGRVLVWNVTLERIPSLKFRRAARLIGTSQSFLIALAEGLKGDQPDDEVESFNADPTAPSPRKKTQVNGSLSARRSMSNTHERLAPFAVTEEEEQSQNPAGRKRGGKLVEHLARPSSSHNLLPTKARTAIDSSARRDPRVNTGRSYDRSSSGRRDPYLSMTYSQIWTRKWAYAVYSYAVVIALALVPIRVSIASNALESQDPFLWAVGYLFGDLGFVRRAVQDSQLNGWIPLPDLMHAPYCKTDVGWVEHYRHATGYSQIRLALFAYWAGVILSGLCVVIFLLPALAEVDTRRKVFHGMMVAMLLPTTFIDPCFLALGLSLVLAVFLLLDLVRASQLQPLSRPLARFLAPYVDGRDLRGPVIVSHIFLLIGCAIPLWLSLAAYDRCPRRALEDPWHGWELSASSNGQTRDLSMLAGVVCVGMGDAAASLIGRRFGRRKWPWAGGKSLEGSAAFAIAVTVGLMAGRAWLSYGEWNDDLSIGNYGWEHTSKTVVKAGIAACGASFTEAVLTGANDNVVVPVILWLLVRGLDV